MLIIPYKGEGVGKDTCSNNELLIGLRVWSKIEIGSKVGFFQGIKSTSRLYLEKPKKIQMLRVIKKKAL